MKKHLEVGHKLSLLTSFIYITNLIVIAVYKIGFSRLLHVIVLLLATICVNCWFLYVILNIGGIK